MFHTCGGLTIRLQPDLPPSPYRQQTKQTLMNHPERQGENASKRLSVLAAPLKLEA